MGRVLQFSDVHFGREHADAAAAAVEYAHATPNDLVLITGDITQNGYTAEFEAAARWIKAMPERVFVTVGNHDVPCWQARLNWSKGVIDLDQTRRAAEALRTAPGGALRILACHHPLVEMIGTPMTGDVIRGEAAAHIFAEAGVDLITTGHTHQPFALPLQAGDEFSYAVGCGTLSHRERGAPPSFNRIDWDADAVTVTAMAWEKGAFVDSRAWTLPRRGAAK